MPFFDRCWWLRLLGAVGLFISVAAMVVGLVFTYQWDQLADPDFVGDSRLFLGVYAGIVLLLLWQAVCLARNTQSARDRYRRRVAALNGNHEAIPRAATIAVDASRAPDLGTSQLELLRRTTRAGRRAYMALAVFIWVVFGSFIPLGIVVVVLVFRTSSATLFPADPLSRAESIGFMLMLVAVGFVLPVALIALTVRTLATDIRGRPYGVVADADGITYDPRAGSRWQVRWGEMRLLEVSLPSSSSLTPDRSYRLYAGETTVEWSDASRSSWETTTGLTQRKFAERHQALLDLIAARTGLLPRTFEKELQREEVATSRPSPRLTPLQTAGCLTIILLPMLGFAFALILVPLSTYPPLNVLEGGALAAALVLTMSGLIIQGFAQRIARRRRATTLDPVMVASDPGAVYVLVQRTSLPARIISLLAGVLLVVGLLPVLVLWLPDVGRSLAPGADLRIADGFGMIAAYILLVCGLMGVLLIVATVRSTTTTYRADSDGLSQSIRGRERTRILWRSLADFAALELADSSRIYRATDSEEQLNLVWTDGPSDARQALNPGETLIAGGQLAEIVARRSGVSLRVSTDPVKDWSF